MLLSIKHSTGMPSVKLYVLSCHYVECCNGAVAFVQNAFGAK
jgi:hypothetical protein